MLTPSKAKRAAVATARGRRAFGRRAAAAFIGAMLLSACVPETTRLAGHDPADPAANVAPAGYSPPLAPYTSLRPAAPAPWRERNDSVAPQTKRGTGADK